MSGSKEYYLKLYLFYCLALLFITNTTAAHLNSETFDTLNVTQPLCDPESNKQKKMDGGWLNGSIQPALMDVTPSVQV